MANLDLPNNVPRWLSGRAARDFEVSVFETHRPRRRVSARFNNFFRDFCEDPSAIALLAGAETAEGSTIEDVA